MSRYPEPLMEQPSDEELREMEEDGISLATDGICEVKNYTLCEHGYPCWLLYLGYT